MKIRLIATLLLIALTASACNKSASEPVEIHFQVSFTKSMSNLGSELKQYTDAIENFHKLNPFITVVIDYLPESAIKQITVNGEAMTQIIYTGEDMIKLLESQAPPDIMGLPPVVHVIAEKKGLLVDLARLAGPQEIDINQNILDSATVNGKLLSLPNASYPNAIFYNKDLFDAAHVPYPQGDWTWEQFREISKKVDPTHAPILTYDIFNFDLLMRSTGKWLLSPDGTTSVGYMDSPEAIRTLQWFNAYYHDSDTNMAPKSMLETFQLFDSNQVGMIKSGMGISMRDNSKMGIAPLPHFAGGKRANPILFAGYSVSQKSKHPQEAWKFIKYLALDKNEDSIKLAKAFVTTSKRMAEATGQSSDPAKSIFVDELNYTVKSSSDNNPFYMQAWNEELNSEFQKLLLTSDKDLPAKLHELALKLDQELNRLNTNVD